MTKLIYVTPCAMCGKIGVSENMVLVEDIDTGVMEVQHSECYHGMFSEMEDFDYLPEYVDDFPPEAPA